MEKISNFINVDESTFGIRVISDYIEFPKEKIECSIFRYRDDGTPLLLDKYDIAEEKVRKEKRGHKEHQDRVFDINNIPYGKYKLKLGTESTDLSKINIVPIKS